MSFVNSYRAPAPPIYSEDANEPYDINFSIPIPSCLETSRVKLVPFTPSVHAKTFFSAFQPASVELSRYLPFSIPNYPDFLNFVEWFRSNPNATLFAIIDKTKPRRDDVLEDNLAGVIGFLNASTANLAIEIAPVITLPKFQRTFVTKNAVGALLRFCLDVPSEGGLGFRRVCWTAHPDNLASVKVAERMGMKIEGHLRWTWAIGLDKVGKKSGDGRGEMLGRDSVLLAICWDDWEKGGKEHVENLINRI